MSSEPANTQGPARLDRLRAWLGIAAALAAVAAKAAGKAGVVIVGVVTLLQWLNLTLWRRDSATREGGRSRYVSHARAAIGSPTVRRAERLFRVEELAWLGTAFWWIVLCSWALGVPVHPLLYAVMLLLAGIVLLLQLYPQLRGLRGPATQRTIPRRPSQD